MFQGCLRLVCAGLLGLLSALAEKGSNRGLASLGSSALDKAPVTWVAAYGLTGVRGSVKVPIPQIQANADKLPGGPQCCQNLIE